MFVNLAICAVKQTVSVDGYSEKWLTNACALTVFDFTHIVSFLSEKVKLDNKISEVVYRRTFFTSCIVFRGACVDDPWGVT